MNTQQVGAPRAAPALQWHTPKLDAPGTLALDTGAQANDKVQAFLMTSARGNSRPHHRQMQIHQQEGKAP